MQIHMPKLQELQGKLQEARIRNDQIASKKRFVKIKFLFSLIF
jgi:hypothetical protein